MHKTDMENNISKNPKNLKGRPKQIEGFTILLDRNIQHYRVSPNYKYNAIL